ncbi:peptidoglycan DD-metalloendopeptidase family protein [Usitatibacter palustris]|uniref:Murein hydrolase activator NlpD n=1 Tax=Usitatibacter palustris TaxID=2732487 RepID=A0A6M4HAH3_9PROT|nr:peptidoglycan DD-metalloendopeptidase family protein [Usitatibacter palustris]QJR15404.1 Murein hydrolase activator NlpD [Usitatibacter palustris]
MKKTKILTALAILALAGCASRQPAPVTERAPPPAPVVEAPPPAPEKPLPKPIPTHTVKRGETLVGIALQYGLDYRELAAWNNITNVNVISVGRVLVLGAAGDPGTMAGPIGTVTTPLALPGTPIEARPLANTPQLKVEPRGQKVPYSDKALAQFSTPELTTPGAPAVPAPSPAPVAPAPPPASITPEPEKPAPPPAATAAEEIEWVWPVKGKVLAPFTDSTKGMDIAGKKGTPVVAASAGRVVYAGAGLRGYGKLVIIKHNNTWLSAYAHNDAIVVKEQQDVKKGQKIAEMGSSDADQVKLHFEVRKQGKPVDPQKVLPAQ